VRRWEVALIALDGAHAGLEDAMRSLEIASALAPTVSTTLAREVARLVKAVDDERRGVAGMLARRSECHRQLSELGPG
jgi:hypothetical protein